ATILRVEVGENMRERGNSMSVRTVVHPAIFFTAMLGLLVCSAEPTVGVERQDDAEANIRRVNLFDAMEKGDIEVKFIPRDATRANLLVENKTKQPLHVHLPDAFAAVPIQAQFGGGGMGGM